jgi:hypothetical protein
MSNTRNILRSNERVQKQHDAAFDRAFAIKREAERLLQAKRRLQFANAWVHGNLRVDEDAFVDGNAKVHGNAKVRVTVSSEKRNLPWT